MIDETDPAKANAERFFVMVVMMVAVLLLGIGLKAVSSHFEAAAYNRATGSNVSTWDAMWIELRVQAEPKEKK